MAVTKTPILNALGADFDTVQLSCDTGVDVGGVAVTWELADMFGGGTAEDEEEDGVLGFRWPTIA